MSWAYEPGALEAATLADMLAIPAHRCMHTVAPWRQTQCGLSARSCGFWLLSWGCPVFSEAHGHHEYASSSSRLVDMCNWCGCRITRQKAPARLVAQHQNPAKMRTALALLSHGYLPYSVASDSKLLKTSRGLGTGGPAARRDRGQQRARGGESMERALCSQS